MYTLTLQVTHKTLHHAPFTVAIRSIPHPRVQHQMPPCNLRPAMRPSTTPIHYNHCCCCCCFYYLQLVERAPLLNVYDVHPARDEAGRVGAGGLEDAAEVVEDGDGLFFKRLVVQLRLVLEDREEPRDMDEAVCDHGLWAWGVDGCGWGQRASEQLWVGEGLGKGKVCSAG